MVWLSPPARMRALYYLLFTMLGVFHAEVLSRSQPWALVDPAMVLIVWPVYGVHYLVLGDLLLRRKATSFVPVFLSGCLLGMYEFIITKVYWVPPWNPASGAGVGFAWFEVIWVGFAWHAFMSFLIPFYLMQRVFLPGAGSPWATREVRWIAVGAPLFTAVFAAAFVPVPFATSVVTLITVCVSLALIAGVSFLFTTYAPAWGYRQPDDLVLGPAGLRVAVAAMAVVYLIYGLTLNVHLVPLGIAALVPVPIYAVLIGLLYPHLKAGARTEQGAQSAVYAADAMESAPTARVVGPPLLGLFPPPLETPSISSPAGYGPVQGPAPPGAPAQSRVRPSQPWDGPREFILRYALIFAVLIGAFAFFYVLAAPFVYIRLFVLMYGSAVAAMVLLVWSARESWLLLKPAPSA